MTTAFVEADPARADDGRAGFDRVVGLLRHLAGWMRPREPKLQVGYLIPERGGYGWYVVAKEPAFDFELNKELSAFGAELIRRGFPVHAALLPGSVPPAVPADGIAVTPSGEVAVHAQ